VNQGTRYEQALREQERRERNARIERRKYLANPAPVTAFSILDAIKADPNVSPAFRAVIRPTTLAERIAYKCGHEYENRLSADLYFARGGSGE
jgi:hypothetical protein